MAKEQTRLGVLLIDDDEDFAFALSRMLTREGYQVRRAEDGEAGVNRVRARTRSAWRSFAMPRPVEPSDSRRMEPGRAKP